MRNATDSGIKPIDVSTIETRIIDITRSEKEIADEKSKLISEIEFTVITNIRHLRNIAGDDHTSRIVREGLEQLF